MSDPVSGSSVFFDLDGTLTDPKLGITRSIQFALQSLDMDSPDPDSLHWCIGPPLRGSFQQLLGNDSLVEPAMVLYRERFGRIGLFENAVYDGVEAALQQLMDTGAHLYVATSKPTVYATRILDHFDLSRFFGRIFGSELDGRLSDKSELIRFALTETGADTASAIMIGDRKHDMIGAVNNDVRAIGVLYGYGDRDELLSAGAVMLCDAPSDIPASVFELTPVPISSGEPS